MACLDMGGGGHRDVLNQFVKSEGGSSCAVPITAGLSCSTPLRSLETPVHLPQIDFYFTLKGLTVP